MVPHRRSRPLRAIALAVAPIVVAAIVPALASATHTQTPAAPCDAPDACSVLGQAEPQGHGVFRFPQGIGFSPGGAHVFVGDQYSSVVQKFSIHPASECGGTLPCAKWAFDLGGHADGRQNGRLGVIGGVATDRNGHVFVLDSQNDRVQVFASTDGTWLGAFGEYGTGEGQFDLGENTGSGGISVWQKPGTTSPVVVHVADQRNHRVQRFTVDAVSGLPSPLAGSTTSDGVRVVPRPDADWVLGSLADCYATSDCTSSEHNFHLNYPQGVSVNPGDWTASGTGRIYIADDRNHRVLIWNDMGSGGVTYAGQIGSYGTGQGQFRFPYDVGVDWHSPNYLYVADNNNHRIQQFDAGSYVFQRMWGRFGSEHGNFEYPRALAALDENPNGGVFVADTANNRIQGFDVGGRKSIDPFGVAGRGAGYVTRPFGVTVDAAGDVYIADTFAHRIQKLAPDGTYLGQWGYISANSGYAAPSSGEGEFHNPRGVAYDAKRNHVWVADTTNNRVQQFTTSGAFVAAYTGFSAPYGIAADTAGTIYVADTGNDRIRRFNGSRWATIAGQSFRSPRGVAAGANDVLYVADAPDSTGSGGVYRYEAGAWTSVTGAPTHPGGVWVDRARNRLYASDVGGDRILRQDLATGTWEAWGANGTVLGQLIDPRGLTTDADGRLLITDAYNNRIQRWAFTAASSSGDTTEPSRTVTLDVTPPSATAYIGGTAAQYSVAVATTGDAGSSVSFSVSGCPKNVSCTFATNPLTLDSGGKASTTLTAKASRKATATSSSGVTLDITATTSGGLTDTKSVQLVVAK